MKKPRRSFFFVLPCIAVLLAVSVSPFLAEIYITLHKWSLLGIVHPFVGLENWTTVLSNPAVQYSVLFTVGFAFSAMILELVFGMGLALLLDVGFPGSSVVSGLALIPMAVPPVVAALSWKMMMDPDIGILTYYATMLGIPRVDWWSGNAAPYAVLLVDLWQWTPFMVLVLFAGLRSISREPLEAARVDGASSWQTFRLVTLPMLQPVMMIGILFRLVGALKTFDAIWITTKGGPANLTSTLMVLAYQQGFLYFNMDYASVISIISLLLAMICVMALVRMISREGVAK